MGAELATRDPVFRVFRDPYQVSLDTTDLVEDRLKLTASKAVGLDRAIETKIQDTLLPRDLYRVEL